ncbi:MAG: flagellar hook-basal body protein [Lachnospiraceae bacterium]|nr:flagellar hook-basal body protein [Lachnospiraceae bacterium]
MVKGLYTSYTGMINEQHRLDTVANSIANFDTIGFKKEGATSQAFDDVLAYKIKDVTEAGNLPRRMGIINPGVKIGENYVDWSEGSFQETGNTFDLAIAGKGFFAVEFTSKSGQSSTKYTRDGKFTVDMQGNLTTVDGDYVLNSNGQHIKLDPLKEAVINTGGQIYQNGTLVGTIGVTDFANYDYLEKYGENMYQPVEGATQIQSAHQIYSGYLEQSNVSIVDEMVNMISIQRSYEANQKVIQTFDSSLDIAANQLGKV